MSASKGTLADAPGGVSSRERNPQRTERERITRLALCYLGQSAGTSPEEVTPSKWVGGRQPNTAELAF